MRGYTVYGRCKLCRAEFFYVRTNPHGRKRTTCDNCVTKHKRDLVKARVAAYRQRQREAQNQRSKQPSGKKPRPVPVGSREGTERATPKRKAGGIFAELPEPNRTSKRKALGLP
jgi:hypothetical protein